MLLIWFFVVSGALVVTMVGLLVWHFRKRTPRQKTLVTPDTHRNYQNLVTMLKEHVPFGFAHVNDGEAYCLLYPEMNWKGNSGKGLWYQKADSRLHEGLKECLRFQHHRWFVGVPCDTCFPQFSDLWRSFAPSHPVQATTFHHHYAQKSALLQIMRTYQEVAVVAADDSDEARFREETGLKISSFIQVSSNHAMNDVGPLVKTLKPSPGSLVLLLCGPAARYLAIQLFKRHPDVTVLCLGSYFDQELYGKVYREYAKGTHSYCPTCFPDDRQKT